MPVYGSGFHAEGLTVLQQLRQRIAAGERVLLVRGGKATLERPEALLESGDLAAVLMMDLTAAVAHFDRLHLPPGRRYGLSELAKIAAVPRPTVERWAAVGLVPGSVLAHTPGQPGRPSHRWDLDGMFWAACLGALKRHRLSDAEAFAVLRVLAPGQTEETRRQLAAAQ